MLAAGALLAGCTTRHALGRINDPGVSAQVDAIAARGDAFVHLDHPPGARTALGQRVRGVAAPGLIIEPGPGRTLLLPRDQLTSLSRYDHLRGARDGAIGGAIAGFVVGLMLGILVANTHPGCSDNCGSGPDPGAVGLRAGAVFGVIGTALGAGLGAAVGHEDRFDIAR